MMRSMFTAVTGLRNHQTRIDVIANNLANVNTVGFKKGRVTFMDNLYQQIRGGSAPQDERAGTNSMQIGLGMSIATIDTIQTQSSPQMTGKVTDLHINGDGYFICNDGGKLVYTRAGVFDFDVLGNYYNLANGMKVMGYMGDVETGVIDYNRLVPIDISGHKNVAPKVTEQVLVTGNLDLTVNNQEDLPKVMTKDVYDSLGVKHELKMVFDRDNITLNGTLNDAPAGGDTAAFDFTLRDKDDNELDVTLNMIYDDLEMVWKVDNVVPNTVTISGIETLDPNNLRRFHLQVTDSTNAFNGGEPLAVSLDTSQIALTTGGANAATGTAHFGPGGWNVTTYFDGAAPDDPAVAKAITFDEYGKVTNGPSFNVTKTNLPSGAADLTFSVDYSQLTQYEGDWTAGMDYQDGYGPGYLKTLTIDTTGTIIGSFSNGTIKAMGQVALATFSNPGGLTPLGDNLFEESRNSGSADIGAPGVKYRGTIVPGHLEMSNVDMAMEFTDMIVTQRGFQANSRVITTSDEMLQELVNLKR